MGTYHPFIVDYEKFMASFRCHYPELYKKYDRNIEAAIGGDGRVKITDDDTIRPATREVLHYIIKEYYCPLDN